MKVASTSEKTKWFFGSYHWFCRFDFLFLGGFRLGQNELVERSFEERVGGEYVTFKVYVFLLRTGKASVREVYRGCCLSSPSLAVHHLEKLEHLKLAWKDENGVYHVVARKFGVLRFFSRTGRWLIPRSFFYMMFYLVIAIVSLFLLPFGMREVALVLSIAGFATNLIDTVLFLRLLH